MEFVGYGQLAIFGFFLIAVLAGMLFGMIRGTKRTLKRMLVLVPLFVAAIFLAPLISGLLMDSPLGAMLKDFADDLIGSDAIITAVLGIDGVNAFVWSLPLIFVNIIIFYILLFFFRFIFSPLFSVIFLRKIARKKDKDGNKIRHSKLAGLGIGALFGVIIFAFMFIPINGLLQSLHRIDRYEPRVHHMAQVDMLDTGIKEIDTVNEIIRDANNELQIISTVTRYSGMQFLGHFALGHFSRVNTGSSTVGTVNMLRELEIYFELSRDTVVIIDLVNNVDNPREDLVPVFSDARNVEYFESVINKVFRLAPLLVALDSDLDNFIRTANFSGDEGEEGILATVDLSSIVGDDPEVEERFKEAIYTALGNISSDFFREDALTVLEVMRLLFAEHQVNATTAVSLWEGIDDAIDVVTRGGATQAELSEAFISLLETLSFSHADFEGRTLAEQMYTIIGGMNIFENFLFDRDNADLYQLPIMGFLNDFDLSGIVGEDEELQTRFRTSLYDAMWGIGTDFFRSDMTSLFSVLELVFEQHTINPTISLWEGIAGVVNAISRDTVSNDELAEVFEMLHSLLTITNDDWDGNLAEEVFGIIGGMNIFENFIFDSSNADLYTLPFANFLEGVGVTMAPEEVTIDFSRVMGGMANITTRVVNVGPTVFRLIDSNGDIVELARILNENGGASIVALGEVLEILTNRGQGENGVISDGVTRTMGTSNIMRNILSTLITDNFDDSDDGIITIERVLGPLLDKLTPDGDDILWAEELRTIVKIVEELGGFLAGDLDQNELLDKLLSGDLLGLIATSDIFADIFVDILEEVINDQLPDGVTFDFSGADSGDALRAIGALDVSKLLDSMEDGDNFGDFDDILEMFGGDDGENNLLMLADSGVIINIDTTLYEDLEASLAAWEAGLFDCEDCDDAGCPECEHGIDENPLRRIRDMFLFTGGD